IGVACQRLTCYRDVTSGVRQHSRASASYHAGVNASMDSRALQQILALANAFKEGDLSAGGTPDDQLREEARRALCTLTVAQIRKTVLIDDEVTVALERSRERRFDGDLDPLSVAQMKDALLGPGAAAWARRYRDALTSESVAAIAKVMTNDELSLVA